MLSRRQLRIKALQSLYSFYQSEKTDLAVAEKELFRSIDKVYELYLFLLSLLVELKDVDEQDAGGLQHKHFPKEDELKAKNRLFRISFLKTLSADRAFSTELNNRKLSWQKDQELVRKIYLALKKPGEYRNFLAAETSSGEKDFLISVVKQSIENSEPLKTFIEENDIYWMEDFPFVCHVILKTIRDFYQAETLQLASLYKDEDDRNFVRKLFSTTVLHDKEYEEAVAGKTQNWEVERIAMIDMILLKMSMAELVAFPGIPVKVTINEYIDISKDYSTPRSRQFINGIIDKLADEYKKAGKIVKTGRGLME